MRTGEKKACSRHDECSFETAVDLRTIIPQRRFNDWPEAARCHIGTDGLCLARLDFSIRFNVSFNARGLRKMIARIIGIAGNKNAPRKPSRD